MVMITPPECQGQIVEWSYGADHSGLVYRRRYDRSDNTERWWQAEYADLFPGCGHDGDCDCWSPQNAEPGGRENAWTPCVAPTDE